MKNAQHVKTLKKYLNEIKKKKPTASILRLYTRIKALIAFYKGHTVEQVASCYDISEKSLKRWIKRYERSGCEILSDAERSGRPLKLPKEYQEELKKLIEEQKGRVWVARHVHQIILTVFGVIYSVKYIPELLKKMGLSFHKSIHYLIKKDDEKRRKWIQEKLPEIYKEKQEQGWRIFYQDEVGFQTQGTLAYTWGAQGKKIEIPNYGRHGRMNLLGAFELGTGIFYGVTTSFKVNAMRFRRFICHLKREMRTDKILLICDNAGFHKAKWLTAWIETQSAWLRLEFLPAYSPDFNPIERLWRWMKTEFIHNKCWKSLQELREYLKEILVNVVQCAESLKSLMKKENKRFEKISDYYEVECLKQFDIAA